MDNFDIKTPARRGVPIEPLSRNFCLAAGALKIENERQRRRMRNRWGVPAGLVTCRKNPVIANYAPQRSLPSPTAWDYRPLLAM